MPFESMTPPNPRGRIRSIRGTDPAAGVEISETVPAGVSWLLLAMEFNFATDGAAANRTVRIALDDGVNRFWLAAVNDIQTANTFAVYDVGNVGIMGETDTEIFIIPIPSLRLLSGYRIQTGTGDLQAGDNYSAPDFLVEEFDD